jgi:hypothetical protein
MMKSTIVDSELEVPGGILPHSRVSSCTVPPPSVLIALIAVLLTVALIPLFICSPLPLADYPNHLARMYIISSLPHSPILQRYYEVHWQLIPNLAIDLIVPQLARFMPVERAMLIFTGLTLALLVAGCFAVHRSLFRRPSYAPLAAFLLLYNRQFLWGMLNYLFALGLALVTFALWVALRRRPLGIRCVIFAVLSLMVFISHLSGFGVLGVLIGGYEIHSFLQEKNPPALRNGLIAATVALGLPLVLFSIFSPTAGLASQFVYAGIKKRAIGLFDVFNNYTLALDVATFLLVVAAIGLGLLLRKAHLHSRMWLSLAFLVLIYCIIPSQLFGSEGADRRLVPALFLIAVCSLDWDVPSKYIIATVAVMFLVRTGVVIKNWSAARPIYRADLELIDKVPRGAKLAVAVGELNYPQLNNPPLLHLPNMAVVRREVLTNALFADKGHQPLQFKAEYERLLVQHVYDVDVLANRDHKRPFNTTENPFQRIPLSEFDYLLLLNKAYFLYPVPVVLQPLYSAGDSVLYAVVR